ncbi:MAG: DNA recombination protein RmuC [Acidimicrobiales bacterium]
MVISPALVVGLACIFGALGPGGAWLVFARNASVAPAATERAIAAAVEAMRAERADYLQSALDTTLAVASSKLGDQLSAGKHVIDRERLAVADQVTVMSNELRRVGGLVSMLQTERAEQHGSLTAGLEQAAAVTAGLAATTQSLKEALASPKARGQWGERMAEDVLQLAGFVDGINYTKQTRLDDGGIPDYSFLLPHGHCVHMDVKFPASNYLRWLETPDGADRLAVLTQFKRDVRLRIDELAKRNYAKGPASVDYVLMFIPNESIYGFLHET